jgi:formylglycine-generating enzyme required for sulfatase activity
LRQWKEEDWLNQVNDEWAKGKVARGAWRAPGEGKQIDPATDHSPPATPRWYVNSQAQTMVVIPPGEFVMGPPPSEAGRNPNELQHHRRIGRTFAVSAKPVTVQEFQRFLRGSPKREAWFSARGQMAPLIKQYSPEAHGPIIYIDWYRAAAYCNWLSAQEGIPADQWCYETNEKKLADQDLSVYVTALLQRQPLAAAASSSFFLTVRLETVTRLKATYLSLTGYRLPTEAEWEYACRAGAATSRYYGESEELLGKYGWYLGNSADGTRPVGGKKPNDLGLFDMHGNVWNWCQERHRECPRAEKEGYDDSEDVLSINRQEFRVLRGGSFGDQALNLRSANRRRNVPANRRYNVGFRPARTFTAE